MELSINTFESIWTTSDADKVYVATSSTYYTEGSYSMLMSGTTSSIDTEISKDFGAIIDLSAYTELRFNIKSNIKANWGSSTSVTNSYPVFLKIGFSKDDVTYQEFEIPVYQTDYFEQVILDLSDITKIDRENVRYFKFTVIDESKAFVVYVDNLIAVKPELFYDVEKKLQSTLEEITINNKNINVIFPNTQVSQGDFKFPSITILQTDMDPDFLRELGQDEQRNGGDDSVKNYSVRESWNITFDIKTWALSKIHDIEIQQKLLDALPKRGYILVKGCITPVTLVGYVNNDDSNDQQTVYNKIFTYEVEASGGATYKTTDKLIKTTVIVDYKGVNGNAI